MYVYNNHSGSLMLLCHHYTTQYYPMHKWVCRYFPSLKRTYFVKSFVPNGSFETRALQWKRPLPQFSLTFVKYLNTPKNSLCHIRHTHTHILSLSLTHTLSHTTHTHTDTLSLSLSLKRTHTHTHSGLSQQYCASSQLGICTILQHWLEVAKSLALSNVKGHGKVPYHKPRLKSMGACCTPTLHCFFIKQCISAICGGNSTWMRYSEGTMIAITVIFSGIGYY